jgi:hypothetical protein
MEVKQLYLYIMKNSELGISEFMIQKAKKAFNWALGLWRKINASKTSTILFNVAAFLITILILFWLVFREKDVLVSYAWDINWVAIIISFILFSISLQLY